VSRVIKKMGKSIGTALGLVDDRPDEPKMPKAVVPDPDAKEAARAASRKLQRRPRSGRTSTVLTEGTKLG